MTAGGAIAGVQQGRGVKSSDFTPRARKAITRDRRRIRRSSSILSEIGPSGALVKRAGLTPEQAEVVSTIVETGKKMGATPKELLSAVQTGLVEANLTNPAGGHGTSVGWRQEIDTYGSVGRRMNVRGAARRYFQETAAAGRGAGMTSGQLSQAVQRSAYPERYDERVGEARNILSNMRPNSPKAKAAERSAKKAKARLAKRGFATKGAGGGGVKPLPGPYAGAQAMVRRVVGAAVKGDKEPGHASGGMHDPANPDAYAQDIQLGSSNPAENEPVYDQRLLNRISKNIKRMGGSVGKITPGQGMITANVRGYELQIIPDSQSNFHGSGPHLHIGAEWKGPGATDGSSVSASGGGYVLGSVSGNGQVKFGDSTLTGPQRRARRLRRDARGRRLGETGSAFSSRSSSLGPSSSLLRRYGNPVV